MPSAVVHNRISLDETSLNFRFLTPETLEHHIDDLNATLIDLRDDGLEVRVHPWLWDAVDCLDGILLCDFLYQKGKSEGIDRDTRLLLATLLDRCASWDEAEEGCLDSVTLQAPDNETPPTVHDPALPGYHPGPNDQRSQHGLPRLPSGDASRFRQVWGRPGNARIFFFTQRDELCGFWRSLYFREQVKESLFFDLAEYAFPRLVLHPSLKFGHFEGRYVDVRDKVVRILAAVNDHLSTTLEKHAGIPSEVAAAFGAVGVDLSPESPKTRSSHALMTHREVALNGKTYLCEWHAKLEPHRNRIHFSLPAADLGGRIVIGLFAVHLPT